MKRWLWGRENTQPMPEARLSLGPAGKGFAGPFFAVTGKRSLRHKPGLWFAGRPGWVASFSPSTSALLNVLRDPPHHPRKPRHLLAPPHRRPGPPALFQDRNRSSFAGSNSKPRRRRGMATPGMQSGFIFSPCRFNQPGGRLEECGTAPRLQEGLQPRHLRL